MIATKSPIRANLRKIRLRTTLVVPFVLQIVAAVGLVGYLSYRNEQQATEELANRLMNEAGNRVSLYLEDYLKIPPLINRLNAEALRSGRLDVNNDLQSGRYLIQQRKLFTSIHSIQRINPDGNYVVAGRYGESYNSPPSFLGLLLSEGNDSSIYRLYKSDSEGNPTQLVNTFTNTPAKQRIFYKTAVAAKTIAWTPTFKSILRDDLLINSVLPIYDSSTGELQVIFGSIISLSFSHFLETIKISPRANIYVIEPNGSLVTNSTRESVFKDSSSGEKKKEERLTIFDTPSPILRAAGDRLRQQVGDLSKLQGSKQLKFKVQEEPYFLTAIPFQDEIGLQLTILVTIPESDFLAQIHQNAQKTALLCLLATLVAIAIGILTARWLTHPIERITQASEDMAEGHLEQHVKPSSITELDKLSNSFNSMAGQLKESFEVMRQAEENYRGIFENALEGIFQSSPDGRWLSANPAMARIFGYDSPAAMIDSLTDLRHQVYVNPQERDEFQTLMQEHGQVKDFEFQAYRKDRSVIWAQMDARAVQNASGVLYYEGIMQDISDRKRQKEILEDKVKERTAELATANEEISVLNEKLKVENLRLSAEVDVARQIQMMILPKPEELEIEGLDIAGYMEPADEVGGDYYDVLHTDGIVTIGIGDVTGHGLESGILMLMVQTAVRTLKEVQEHDPVIFLDTLNRTIYKNVQRMNSEKNLTLAILNYADGAISISGQHEETIVVRQGGQIERIDTMDLGFPIGLDDDIVDFISHTIVKLQPGDGVVVYTDGIPEAKDMDKKQYGMEPLFEVISHNWHKSASEIKEAIIADLRQFIGKQKVFDDITLLVFKRQDNALSELPRSQSTLLSL